MKISVRDEEFHADHHVFRGFGAFHSSAIYVMVFKDAWIVEN